MVIVTPGKLEVQTNTGSVPGQGWNAMVWLLVFCLVHLNPFTAKYDQRQIRQNPKFYFVNFFKTNNTTCKYYQRDFIWMVAP